MLSKGANHDLIVSMATCIYTISINDSSTVQYEIKVSHSGTNISMFDSNEMLGVIQGY